MGGRNDIVAARGLQEETMVYRSAGGVAYEERGRGIPFIALHGFTLDRRMCLGAFEPLFDEGDRAAVMPSAGYGRPEGGLSARTYRRVYPDSPFMGESADLGTASSDAMLEALGNFIREVVPEGPFMLAGESYGGYLVRGLARAFPGRVAGAFFLCPSIVARRADRDLPASFVVREEDGWADGASAADVAEFEDCAVVKSRYSLERTRAEVIAGIRLARHPALERLQAGSYEFSFDGLARGEGFFDAVLDAPACFVLGRQDGSVGWKDALRLCDRYPRASYHIVDAAGHNLQIDQPGIFGAAFVTWLLACEAHASEAARGTATRS